MGYMLGLDHNSLLLFLMKAPGICYRCPSRTSYRVIEMVDLLSNPTKNQNKRR